MAQTNRRKDICQNLPWVKTWPLSVSLNHPGVYTFIKFYILKSLLNCAMRRGTGNSYNTKLFVWYSQGSKDFFKV